MRHGRSLDLAFKYNQDENQTMEDCYHKPMLFCSMQLGPKLFEDWIKTYEITDYQGGFLTRPYQKHRPKTFLPTKIKALLEDSRYSNFIYTYQHFQITIHMLFAGSNNQVHT